MITVPASILPVTGHDLEGSIRLPSDDRVKYGYVDSLDVLSPAPEYWTVNQSKVYC